MMRRPIYLDYMATTPVDPKVKAAMCAYLNHDEGFGNANSKQHIYGWQAEEALSLARQQVADCLHTDPLSITWTSGATEAINLAIQGSVRLYHRKGRHIVTFNTEHKAVLETCAYLESQGFEVTFLPVPSSGLIDMEAFEAALRADTILVSVLHANNEIGVIQDINAMGQCTRARGILLHVDAAQSAGKIPIHLNQLPVDFMSLSAHKVYGPKGIGALYVCRQPRVHLMPLFFGGGHLRPGTPPTHQIVGMGMAFHLASQNQKTEAQSIQNLRDRLWQGLKSLGDIHLNGDETHRLPGNLNVSIEGVEGTLLLSALKDIAVSSGAACTTQSIEPSHVLTALGRSTDLALSSLRFSIGRYTTSDEIDHTIKHCQHVIHQLRQLHATGSIDTPPH